jgi:hypothetical protein
VRAWIDDPDSKDPTYLMFPIFGKDETKQWAANLREDAAVAEAAFNVKHEPVNGKVLRQTALIHVHQQEDRTQVVQQQGILMEQLQLIHQEQQLQYQQQEQLNQQQQQIIQQQQLAEHQFTLQHQQGETPIFNQPTATVLSASAVLSVSPLPATVLPASAILSVSSPTVTVRLQLLQFPIICPAATSSTTNCRHRPFRGHCGGGR